MDVQLGRARGVFLLSICETPQGVEEAGQARMRSQEAISQRALITDSWCFLKAEELGSGTPSPIYQVRSLGVSWHLISRCTSSARWLEGLRIEPYWGLQYPLTQKQLGLTSERVIGVLRACESVVKDRWTYVTPVWVPIWPHLYLQSGEPGWIPYQSKSFRAGRDLFSQIVRFLLFLFVAKISRD